MINTSTEYKKAIQKDREFRIQDTITFKDGTKQGKTITLSTGDFMSYSINGATSSSGKFDIGAAVIKKYTAVLNNMNDKFSEYDFEGADIRSYIGLKLEDGSWEVLSKGTYRVCKARSKDLTISIEAYDYMLFFDQPYSKSKLSYPATINEIIADACLSCQMTYNAQTIQNGRFTVEKRPEDEALTFRDIISYCAQIMCCYARISNTNALEFGWYDFSIFDRNDNILDGGNLYDYTGSNADGGNFKSYSGDITDGGSFTDQRDFYHLFLLGSQDIDIADIVITGVKATADNSSDDNKDKTESFLYGTEDYALSLEGNPLIQSRRAEEVARYVGPRIVGRRFRPLSITCLSDPSIEEGDVAYVTDRKNNTYRTVITNTTFSMGGYQSVVCDAETKTENNYTRYGAESKLLAQAHKDMQNEISQYDIAVQQLNSLALNSLGYYETITREDDGSMIKYMHDKPEMKDSKVVYKRSIDGFFISLDGGENFKSGFDKYGNAVLNVIQAIGINFDWAKGGTLTLGGKDHENGVLKLLDKGNNTIMTLTENGLNVLKGDISGSTITGSEFKNATGTFEISSEGRLSSYSASKKRSLILDDAGIYVSGMTEAGYEGTYGLRCTSGLINADYHSQGIYLNKQVKPDVITEDDIVFWVQIEERSMICRCSAVFYFPVSIRNNLYAQKVTAGEFVNDSDPRLKDIESHITNAESLLKKLETIIFRWKDGDDNKLHMGLNADNVQKVFGNEYGIVSEGMEGYKGVSYIEIIPLLVSAVNIHSERLERIEKKLDKLLQEGIR